PEDAVPVEPGGRVLQPRALEPRGSELGGPAPADQPRALENLEVLGDRLDADRERPGELVHRGVTDSQLRENLTAGRVGECRERAAELVETVFIRSVDQLAG